MIVRRFSWLLLWLVMPIGAAEAPEQPRYPAPEFESGYGFPITQTPATSGTLFEIMDMAVLVLVLGLASYAVLRNRSRRLVFSLMLFSLLYFGFWRQGCVCPIGAIGNVSLALSDPGYAMPLTVLFFFLVPLIFSLFFGRVFCASACPLGAAQDIMLLKPVTLPRFITSALGLFPYVYLALAVVYATLGSRFIICEFDPFVPLFRLSGEAVMIALGGAFLLLSMFVGRPYCRFFCPYSVLLKWTSRVSKWHMSITPHTCIQCRLCEDACPFDAIEHPRQPSHFEARDLGLRRMTRHLILFPVWILLGAGVGYIGGDGLARGDKRVSIAEELVAQTTQPMDPPPLNVEAYRRTGKPQEQAQELARNRREDFRLAGMWAGAFLGLILGIRLIRLSLRRQRPDYQPDRADCFSCGRCFAYCPQDNQQTHPTEGGTT